MSTVYAAGALLYGLCSYRALFGRWPFGLLNRAEDVVRRPTEPDPCIRPDWAALHKKVQANISPSTRPAPEAGKDAAVGSVDQDEWELLQIRSGWSKRIVERKLRLRELDKEAARLFPVRVDEYGNPIPPSASTRKSGA